MKVLIADDSGFMRSLIKDIVIKINPEAEIIEAGDGEEALNVYSDQNPDLVLLDIIMPKVDGIAVLKSIGPEAKVIVISSVGQEEIIKEAQGLGAIDFIEKPFDVKQVRSKLEDLLTESSD